MDAAIFDPGGYAFSLYSLPLLVVGSLAAALGFATLIRERFSAVSVAFCIMQASVAVWLVGYGAVYSASNPGTALALSRLVFIGLSFIPTTVLAFSLAVTGRHSRAWPVILLTALLSVAFSSDSLTVTWLTGDVRKFWWGHYVTADFPLALTFLAFMGACLGGAVAVLRAELRITKSRTQTLRLKALLVALSIAFLATVDWLAAVGLPVYTFGYLFEGIFVVLATRAIWRYRLVDVTSELAANQIIATMGDALIVLDEDGVIRVANRASAEMLGIPRHELLGRQLSEIDPGPFADTAGAPEDDEIQQAEVSYQRLGIDSTAVVSTSALKDDSGNPIATVHIAHDITERKRVERAVRKSEALYRTLIETSPDAVIVTDESGTVVMANRRAAQLLEVPSPDELIGKNAADSVVPEERARLTAALQEVTAAQVIEDAEYVLLKASGEIFPAELSLSRIQDSSGDFSGFMAVARDITGRKKAEEAIRHFAFHDSLTDLANRAAFIDRTTKAIAAAAENGQKLALLYMDLDGMKTVNDTFGHSTGDEVLRCTADRLRVLIREQDLLARVGGDEFVLVIPAIRDEGLAAQVAQRILDGIRQPFLAHGHTCRLSVSVGIAVFPGDGTDIEGLLHQADEAMYRAKEQGGDEYVFALAGGDLAVVPV